MRHPRLIGATLAGLLLATGVATVDVAAQEIARPKQEHAGEHHGRHGPGGAHDGMIERLVEQRAELNLTDAQVSRLRAIHADVERRAEPLHRQLRETMGERPDRAERRRMTDEQRAEMRRRREAARPVMEQLRTIHRDAMEQVRAVLTEEQQARLRERMEARRGERHERHGDHPRGERPGRRAPADG